MDPLGLSGQVLDDKYAVDTAVGEGGFAVVYKAMHMVLKRPVALKVFHAAVQFTEAEREALVQGFVQEAAVLADLSERSAAICQARDVGTLTTPQGHRMPYMVLEWLEGKTLEAQLEDEEKKGTPRRSMDQVVRLLEPIAEALSLAHGKGIAHRDVKPSNIFLLGDDRQGAVKLLDFGIAKVVEASHKTFSRTRGETSSFTPAYGAPEQFSRDHGSTGPWTDVFSLALVMCEVVSGKPALGGDNFMQLAVAATDPRKRPTPRALGARVSDTIESVFRKALSVAPTDRYQTVGEFWTALQTATGVERRSGFADVSAFVSNQPPALDLPDLEVPQAAPSKPSLSAAPQGSGAYGMIDFDWDDAVDVGVDAKGKGGVAAPTPSRPSPPISQNPLPLGPTSQRPMTSARPSTGSGIELASGVRSGMRAPAESAPDHHEGSPLGLVAVMFASLAAAGGMVYGLHGRGGWRPFDHTPALLDGTSVALSGGAAAVAIMLCIVSGSMALLREPRAWAMLLTSLGFLGMGIGFIVITVSATPAGEVGPPTEGAFVIPFALPLVPLGAALALALGGARRWREDGQIALGLGLGLAAGGLFFTAVELAFGTRLFG
jgi:serine/threonine protein kinase